VYLEIGSYSYNEGTGRWEGLFDPYDRVLAYVWLNAPPFDTNNRHYTVTFDDVQQSMFNARLLLSGLAVVKLVSPNDTRYALWFQQLSKL